MSPFLLPFSCRGHGNPGHADLVGTQKYGLTDVRDILERASARETAARVAGGAGRLRDERR